MRGIITVFPAGPDPSDASQAVCASRWQVQGTRLFPTEWCVWECEPPAGDLLHLSGSTSPFPANSNHSTTSSNAVSALPASRYSNSWCRRGRHGIWWNSSVAAVCLRSAEVRLIDSDIVLVICSLRSSCFGNTCYREVHDGRHLRAEKQLARQ